MTTVSDAIPASADSTASTGQGIADRAAKTSAAAGV